METYLVGASAAAFSFCLGYGFRRLNLKWENQAKRAEQKARLHAEQLQATVSASLDGIVVIDADGNVVDFSESAEQIFGYRKEEVLGFKMAELIVPERYRAALNSGISCMLETGQSEKLGERIEIESLRSDGTEFMSELAISKSPSANGNIFVAYIRDISMRIAAQKELVAAKEAAEAASEAKSRFLATMSHEIRTPFNAVLGILDILGETRLNKEQQKLVRTAESSSIALLRVINDVLDYARMSSGQAKLLTFPFRANAVFDDVVELFRSQAEDKGISIELQIDRKYNSLHLEGDIGRIRQILLNFVSNAIKFTENGTLTLRIDLEEIPRNECLLKCSVSDTGIGIEKEQIKNLFEEFFMADDTESRKHEGTGLGLTISRRLAELMGGNLGCESELGKGSTFWMSVSLPVTSAAAVNDRYEKKDFNMEHCRILVAEDNATNQMVIRHIFEGRCAELTVVDDGAQALEILEQKEFDIILMDIFMPKLNGKETTRIIRSSNNRHKNTPIIALTAMGSFQDLDALREDGVNEVVTKPFKKEKLFDAISSVLGRADGDEALNDMEFGGFADQLDEEEIPIFREQLRIDLSDIRSEYCKVAEQSNWENLARPSHTLKGLAGTYGMNLLCELAERANLEVKGETPQPCPELIQTTINILSDYIDNIDSLFNRARDAA